MKLPSKWYWIMLTKGWMNKRNKNMLTWVRGRRRYGWTFHNMQLCSRTSGARRDHVTSWTSSDVSWWCVSPAPSLLFIYYSIFLSVSLWDIVHFPRTKRQINEVLNPRKLSPCFRMFSEVLPKLYYVTVKTGPYSRRWARRWGRRRHTFIPTITSFVAYP